MAKREAYAWAIKPKGAPDAKVAARELERITKDNGGSVTPEIVLNSARSNDSPLHNIFDWDDSVAAEKWRIVQARQVIAQLRIVRVADPNSENERSVAIRAWSNLHDDERGSIYKPTVACMKVPAEREQILEHARQKLRECRDICKNLEEFAPVVSAIDQALAS